MSAQKQSGAISKGQNTSRDAGKLTVPGSVVLTACVRLGVTAEVSRKLEKTRMAYRDACNFLVPFVREHPEQRNWQRFNLHHAAYRRLRERIPELGAQYACNAIRSVSSAYKTEMAGHPRKSKDEPLREIHFRNPSVHLDKNTIRYQADSLTATITTVDRRVQVTLCPGKHQTKLLGLGKIRESNLVLHTRAGKDSYWALHVSVEIRQEKLQDLTDITIDRIAGVDLGENNPAAMSTGKVWKGGKIKDDRDRYLGHRARLQRNGSQSARRHLRKASGRESRHVRHVNHCISREIVEQARAHSIRVLVLEDLTHIRERIRAGKRMRSRLNRWPFRQLQEMIRYKALLAGISVLTVDPRYTSQTCSGCGAIGTRHRHRFTCPNCGLRAHSDLNASRNLRGLGYLLIAQGLP